MLCALPLWAETGYVELPLGVLVCEGCPEAYGSEAWCGSQRGQGEKGEQRPDGVGAALW